MIRPLELLKEIKVLALSQDLNIAKVEAGAYGKLQALNDLRVVANEIRLKAEHFRALTVPSLDPKDVEKVDAEHLRRWSNRRGQSG